MVEERGRGPNDGGCVLATLDNYVGLVERLDAHPGPFVLDYETTGLRAWAGDRICGVAVGPLDASFDDVYFPFRHKPGGNLPINVLRPLLDVITSKRWIAHNLAFEYQMTLVEGIECLDLRPTPICTLVGLHVVDENRGNNALKPSCAELFGPDCVKASDEFDRFLADRMLTKGDIHLLAPKDVVAYACDDIKLTRMLFNYIAKIAKEEATMTVWEGTSAYSMLVSSWMFEGVPIDLERINDLQREAERKCLGIMQEARTLRGRAINLDSPQQVAKWLRVPDTKDETLALLRSPEAEIVRRFRTHSKAISSYYRPFKAKAVDGIIHGEFRMDATVAGRLSANNPNLQAIPRDDEVYRVKECILAPPGTSILQADYSMAEVRLICHYSRDVNLTNLILSGKNQHDETAREISIPRQDAKTTNFSIIYGVAAWSLGIALGQSEEYAQKILDKMHARYPGYRRVYGASEQMARRHRFITMWSKRRRHYNRGPYITPYHKASSNLIQGGVGEMLRVRQWEVDRELRRSMGVRQLLQVHDSGVMRVPKGMELEIAPKVKEIMEDLPFNVPMKVDISWGPDLRTQEGEL